VNHVVNRAVDDVLMNALVDAAPAAPQRANPP
jgi:hypothetical protein